MTTWVALLRGINVGGNNKIKMAELRDLLAQLGFQNPQTLLQSGNVVFESHIQNRTELEALLEKETETRLGVKCDYVLRTAEEWRRLIEANPFPGMAASDPSHLLAILAKAPIDPTQLQPARAAIVGHEELEIVDGVLYASFPDGIGTSKLPNAPAYGRLVGRSTARNWNTVLKLSGLAATRVPGHP